MAEPPVKRVHTIPPDGEEKDRTAREVDQGPYADTVFRNAQVFIRGAAHVPPSKQAVRDCMPVLFELLEAEAEPFVRAVLGHFLFVYIYPYRDGNGRLGRFLMNLMLAPAGYVWTVIPVERREEYMGALEQASSLAKIGPLAAFVAELAKAQARRPLPRPR